MEQQKDATGVTPLASSFEDAVRQTAARRVNVAGTGDVMPDTPTGTVHLNPALNPAPPRVIVPERIPVPVINDPGLLRASPSLADLNRAYRADQMGGNLPDQTRGVTAENHQQAITEAAEATQDDIAAKAKEQADKALADATATLNRPAEPARAAEPSKTPAPPPKSDKAS